MGDVQYTNQLRQSMATLSGSSFEALPAMTLLVTKDRPKANRHPDPEANHDLFDTQLQVQLVRRANS